jgi:beta-galactosidase GanA
MILLLFLCTAANTQDKKMKEAKIKTDKKEMKMKMENTSVKLDYPYTAEYSYNFMPGNPAHAKMVLDVWKDWDDNVVDRHADLFSDTVFMMFPNGQSVKGKDSAMTMAKKIRGSLGSVKSTVEAWMPTKSIDRDEDWVLI